MQKEDTARLETARALLDVIPDMVFRLSRDGTFLDFLPARGLDPVVPPHEFLGRKIPDVLPTFGAEAIEKVEAALDSGKEQHLEYTLRDGGGVRHYEARIVACGDDEVVTIVRDITEPKRREESVAAIAHAISGASGDDFFRNLVHQLASLLSAEIVMVGALEPGDAQVVRTIAVLKDGELAENFVYPLAGSPCEAVMSGKACSYPSGVAQKFPRDEGLRRMAIEGYVGAPLFDSQGKPLGVLNALYRKPVVDAAHAESILSIFGTRASGELERMAAEDELRMSEELNRRIVESMPGGIVRASTSGEIIVANEVARELLDSGKNSVWLTEDGSVCRPEERPLKKCLATGEAQPPRVYGVREPTGDIRWGLFTAVPLRSPAEKDDGAVMMFVDVTERRIAEDKQRELEQRMQHAQKLESLGVLAGGIAHDFNNLLTGILGNASLARKLTTQARLTEKLERIEHAAERAAELTNQMLAYAGKGNFLVGPLSLNQVIEELIPLLESSISKKAELTCHLEAELPAIGADRSQLEQVLMNLVTNASDALDGASGTIQVTTRTDADFVCLEVTDSGVGMDEVTRARMFEPFFTTKFTGRGLGLAAVEGIARGHQATIEVDTAPGRGTRFAMRFPALPAEPVEPTPRDPAERDETRATGTVLVVDDEEPVRDVAKSALEEAGYRVLVARDGVEGIEMFERAQSIDVVVLDLSMPRESGERTIDRIREICPEVPVLLTSGYNEGEARSRVAATAAVAGFVHKPFRAADLVAKVDEAARSSPR